MTHNNYPSSEEMIPFIKLELRRGSPIGILVDATTEGKQDELISWCYRNAGDLMGWQVMLNKDDFIISYNNANPNSLNLYMLMATDEQTMKQYKQDLEIMAKVKYIYRV
jgi:hypothetical protein